MDGVTESDGTCTFSTPAASDTKYTSGKDATTTDTCGFSTLLEYDDATTIDFEILTDNGKISALSGLVGALLLVSLL